jgi:hypothetical protein
VVDLEVDVLARDVIRIGRNQTVLVEIENKGNVDAIGVPVMIRFYPEPALVQMVDTFANLAYMDTLFSDPAYNEVFGTDWVPDSIPDVTVAFDSIENREFSYYNIFLPYLRPGEKKILEFTIRYNEVDDYSFEAYVFQPFVLEEGVELRGAITGSIEECIQEVFEKALEDWHERVKDELVDLLLGDLDECGSGVVDAVLAQYGFIYGSLTNEPVNLNELVTPMVEATVSCLLAAGKSIPAVRALSMAKELYDELQKYKDILDDLEDIADKCLPPPDDSGKQAGGAGSTTPEDKFGPSGFDLPNIVPADRHRYLSNEQVFNYRIDYWNKEDATAPAVEVFIRDTLDEDFDLTTFNFTEFGFLRWTVELDGGQYFNATVDMRPDFNLLVNVEGTLNPNTREIYWVHRAVDPTTGDLPDDPFAGYLPPIDSNRYNLGWVNYSLSPKAGLPDGTVFENRAHVNFDGVGPWGKAPPYGPYRNTYDFMPPRSEVLPIEPITADTTFEVSWSGVDGSGSGIGKYSIYVAENANDFEPWLLNTSATSAFFTGTPGNVYHFYSVAEDNVGNIEAHPDTEDVSTSIITSTEEIFEDQFVSFNLARPNPFQRSTILSFSLFESKPVQIWATNTLGSYRELIFDGWLQSGEQSVEWSPGINVSSGLYQVSYQIGQRWYSQKIILAR